MSTTVPVAGAIVSLDPGRDRLVVESAPESEATRGFKNVARYVFRFVQAEQWSGDGGAVSVAVLGEPEVAGAVASNVGLLLAPLLDIALGSSTITEAMLEVDRHEGLEYPNPRHGIWLVPAHELGERSVVDRFGLTISAAGVGVSDVDLALLLVPHGSAAPRRQAAAPESEVAVVLLDAPSADHPETMTLG